MSLLTKPFVRRPSSGRLPVVEIAPDVWLDDERLPEIRCEILPGCVVLHGVVDCYRKKQLAQEIIRCPLNPKMIINQITVKRA